MIRPNMQNDSQDVTNPRSSPDHIRINALEAVEHDTAWKVELSYGQEPSKIVQIVNPSSADNETLLKWYLESHVLKDPFDRLRAQEAEARLLLYAENLHSQLREVLGARELQPENTRILEISCKPSLVSIHRLHWEALEHPKLGLSLSICRNVFGQDDAKRPSNHGTGTDHVNLLYLTARRFEDSDNPQQHNRDINPYVILEPLADTIARLGTDSKIRLEVVRPGSFETLEATLVAAKSDGRKFDIIHLDVHGKVENDR